MPNAGLRQPGILILRLINYLVILLANWILKLLNFRCCKRRRVLMLGYIFAIAIGLSLGLIGGGGSILAVPTLVYIVGVSAKEAIAMSLFVVGIRTVSSAGGGGRPSGRWAMFNFSNGGTVCPGSHGGAAIWGPRVGGATLFNDLVQLVAFGVGRSWPAPLMILKKRTVPKTFPSAVEPNH